MLKAVNLVRGAAADKDLIPVLTHVLSYDGRLQGYNGRMSIDVPCVEVAGMDFTVPAVPFLKAVDACNGEPDLGMTPGGKLRVSKGKFRVLLPSGDATLFPRVSVPRQFQDMPSKDSKAFVESLARLRPFVGKDASRPWACGVLLTDEYAYATNNQVLARCPLSVPFTNCNVPSDMVDELLTVSKRAQAVPDAFWQEDNVLSLRLPGDVWVSSRLFDSEWPDVARMFPEWEDGVGGLGHLLQDVMSVQPFCPDPKNPTVKLGPQGVSTLEGDMCANVDGQSFPECAFRVETLIDVLRVATRVDFSAYPNPVPFSGPGIEGVMVGVRL